MMKRLSILLLLCLAPAAHAEAGYAEAGLAGDDAPLVISVSERDCRHISAHLPGGADYVPGTTADGRTVAPADLNGGYGYGVRPYYEFDIELVDTLRHNPVHALEGNIAVARVGIDMTTGRVTVDGQDVAGMDHAIAEACARLHQTPPKQP